MARNTASRPLLTQVTLHPRVVRKPSATIWFTGLSSTTSTCAAKRTVDATCAKSLVAPLRPTPASAPRAASNILRRNGVATIFCSPTRATSSLRKAKSGEHIKTVLSGVAALDCANQSATSPCIESASTTHTGRAPLLLAVVESANARASVTSAGSTAALTPHAAICLSSASLRAGRRLATHNLRPCSAR